ncbi:hypothetical protein D9M70_619750 [compost metagenome]
MPALETAIGRRLGDAERLQRIDETLAVLAIRLVQFLLLHIHGEQHVLLALAEQRRCLDMLAQLIALR